MGKPSSSQTKPPPSSPSKVRIFKGPNPTNPNIFPKSKSKPKRFKHVGTSHPLATRRSSQLRSLGQPFKNTASTPIQIDFVDDDSANASSQGELPPLSDQPPSDPSSPPLSPHVTPSPSSTPTSSPVPSPQISASASSIASPISSPVPPSPIPDKDGSGLSTNDSFVLDHDSNTEDYSYTADILAPPPSKVKGPSQQPSSSVPQTVSSRKFLPGKILASTVLDSCGFDRISAILRFQGWDKLFVEPYAYYPSLMIQFYESLDLGVQDDYGMWHVSVSLGNSVFTSSSGQFGKHLGVSCAGFGEYFKDGWTSKF